MISLTSIKYYDLTNTLQTLAAAAYDSDLRSQPARVRVAYGYTWPSTYDKFNAIEIAYSAGYGDPEDVPEAIKLGIRKLIAHWYEYREDEIVGASRAAVPHGVFETWRPYRIDHHEDVGF